MTAVGEQLPHLTLDRREEELAVLGELACNSLAEGKPASAVADDLQEQGLAETDARALATLAATNACRI